MVEVSVVEPAAGVEVTGAVGVLPNKPPPPNKLAPVPAVPAEVADASAAGCAMDPCVVVGALSADLRGSPVVCAGTVDAGAVDRVVNTCRPIKSSLQTCTSRCAVNYK